MSSITICEDDGIIESGIPTDYTWLVRLLGTRKILRYLEAIVVRYRAPHLPRLKLPRLTSPRLQILFDTCMRPTWFKDK